MMLGAAAESIFSVPLLVIKKVSVPILRLLTARVHWVSVISCFLAPQGRQPLPQQNRKRKRCYNNSGEHSTSLVPIKIRQKFAWKTGAAVENKLLEEEVRLRRSRVTLFTPFLSAIHPSNSSHDATDGSGGPPRRRYLEGSRGGSKHKNWIRWAAAAVTSAVSTPAIIFLESEAIATQICRRNLTPLMNKICWTEDRLGEY